MTIAIKKVDGVLRSSIRKLDGFRISEELFLNPLFSDANLKAYYRFNSGALTTDSSGNSITLTNNNTVGETASGKFGYAADFGASNTNKYFTSSNTLGIDGGAISISLWVKLSTETTGDTYYFSSQGNNTSKIYFVMSYLYNTGNPYVDFRRVKSGVGTDMTYYNITLGTTNWYHLVLTYDGTNIRGYVNGILQAGAVPASGNGNSPLTPGLSLGATMGGVAPYSGLIDDVAVFNRALSSTEITSLYNSQIKKFMGVSNI